MKKFLCKQGVFAHDADPSPTGKRNFIFPQGSVIEADDTLPEIKSLLDKGAIEPYTATPKPAPDLDTPADDLSKPKRKAKAKAKASK